MYLSEAFIGFDAILPVKFEIVSSIKVKTY